MIRVATGSRLHFGLFHLPSHRVEHPPDHEGLPARYFGGAGLMVEAPGVELTASPAAAWSATGPLAERALAFAQGFARTTPELTFPCHISVTSCAREHAGLGTGTQLGLAVARALAVLAGRVELPIETLGRRVGRGMRSAIGIHGFIHGGFVVDAGQRTPGTVAPMAVRIAFPEAWRIVLVLPPWRSGLHGNPEREAFAVLKPSSPTRIDALCRLVLLGMIPALIEADLVAFGEAVYEFNHHVGEAFVPVQGDIYADRRIAEVIGFVRRQGVRGVGQSSWGPAVFAFVEDEVRGESLVHRLREQFGLPNDAVLLTRARNRGASLDSGDGHAHRLC